MTERRLEMMALGELKPHPRNPRRKKPKDLRASYDRFGYTVGILIDERTGLIAAGHGRWTLLVQMARTVGAVPPEGVELRGGVWYVPVIRGWASKDDLEAEAYLIADNRQTELSDWVIPELAELMTPIRTSELGLAGTGYTPKELDTTLAPMPTARETVGQENTYEQRADKYRNKQVRSIIFDYPLSDYEFVLTAAKAASEAFHTETTAELFVAMLMGWEMLHPEQPA